jgi:TatD DNase family protein
MPSEVAMLGDSSDGSIGPAHPQLVDTHAHLADDRYREDIPGILARAGDVGVVQIVSQGTSADSSEQTVAIAERRRAVFAAVGIHPNEAGEAVDGDWDRIVTLLHNSKVVALGETGLDRYWDKTPISIQHDYFERHLGLAEERGLPVVIHCRESALEILTQLRKRQREVKGVLHSFTGDWDQAQAFLELGLHLGFAGQLTFANKSLESLREAATNVPIDRIVVETDSPYLSPHPFRGRTNEPARVVHVVARLAELRAIPVSELAAATTANARRLFGLPECAPPG